MKNVGLFVHQELSHLGASPDAIINCCCGDIAVEVKCPSSIRNTVPSDSNLRYLEKVNEKIQLKSKHDYMFQIQGQLAITNLNNCIFFVYTNHGYHIELIKFDQDMWCAMVKKLNYFWAKSVVKAMLTENDNDSESIPSLTQKTSMIDISCECAKCFAPIVEVPTSPDDSSLSCGSCEQWFHAKCIGITENDFNTITSWICNECVKLCEALVKDN